ncbi:Gfo/Idh/MocA family protein [Terriglobus sp. TAA 43]|uniref:Gfo/Idh/MocA family protein n=1 Tax=Terriglobus sp. TAA 43 TaxID=278961 RepID=UPI000647E181|nr:Gfo/Idh/MocA family oxidoreductase [Terriglobus sp. TAA 43]
MLNRRDFVRLAAAASAATSLPATMLPQAPKKIRYAAVGLGRISCQHFMPGTKLGQYGEITGLVSGHPDKAAKFAAEYGVPQKNIYTYETYDQMKNNPDIDAVYIGLPNNMHAEYTIRAAQAGKHVLCEKPMANTPADCQAMIDACHKANRKLMIGYRCQLEPTFLQARKMIQDGVIGKVWAIEAANGFNIAPNEWRSDAKYAGGGPLMDVGIYSLNACRWLLQEEPKDISAHSYVDPTDPRFKGVEETIGWVMTFPSGAIATCNTTYGASQEGFTRLHGSKGTLEIFGYGYDGIHMSLRSKPAVEVPQPDANKDPHQFLVESDYFSRCILDNKEPGPNGEEGLRDMQAIARIYAAAKKA